MISIGSNGFQLLINYAVAILVCIIVALALKMPLIPERPVRNSWTNSALYPTPVFAMGVLAVFFSLNIYWIYDGLALAVIVGILSAVFVKYFFYHIFPNPPFEDDSIEGGDEL